MRLRHACVAVRMAALSVLQHSTPQLITLTAQRHISTTGCHSVDASTAAFGVGSNRWCSAACFPYKLSPLCPYSSSADSQSTCMLPRASQAFAGWDPNSVINDPSSFYGCGGNSVWDLNRIEFRHDGYGGSGDKWVTLDHIFLG